MADERKSETQTAIDAGMMMAEMASGSVDFAVLPPAAQIVDLQKFAAAPRHLVQAVAFEDMQSFNTYVTRFKQDSTTIFCEPKASTLTAFLDYHSAPDTPAWCSHIARLKLQTTEQWDAWNGANRKAMDQTSFAEFIEEHYKDFAVPAAADMLEVAMNFEAKKDVTFSSGIRVNNGQVQFTYNEVIGATSRAGTVEVPATFSIYIRVFKGQTRTHIDARLRYRLKEQRLSIWYELIDRDAHLDTAIDEVLMQVGSALGIDPLIGSVGAGLAPR